jgi:hypothetical protein
MAIYYLVGNLKQGEKYEKYEKRTVPYYTG